MRMTFRGKAHGGEFGIPRWAKWTIAGCVVLIALGGLTALGVMLWLLS